MSDTRIERDSMGELQVPAKALYGAQTQRAVDNFPVSGLRMPAQFIRALLLAKLPPPRPTSSWNNCLRRRARPSSRLSSNSWRRTSSSTSRWMCSRPALAQART